MRRHCSSIINVRIIVVAKNRKKRKMHPMASFLEMGSSISKMRSIVIAHSLPVKRLLVRIPLICSPELLESPLRGSWWPLDQIRQNEMIDKHLVNEAASSLFSLPHCHLGCLPRTNLVLGQRIYFNFDITLRL